MMLSTKYMHRLDKQQHSNNTHHIENYEDSCHWVPAQKYTQSNAGGRGKKHAAVCCYRLYFDQ